MSPSAHYRTQVVTFGDLPPTIDDFACQAGDLNCGRLFSRPHAAAAFWFDLLGRAGQGLGVNRHSGQ